MLPLPHVLRGLRTGCADHQYAVSAKIRLGDLLETLWGAPKFRSLRSRINCSHVDFVLRNL